MFVSQFVLFEDFLHCFVTTLLIFKSFLWLCWYVNGSHSMPHWASPRNCSALFRSNSCNLVIPLPSSEKRLGDWNQQGLSRPSTKHYKAFNKNLSANVINSASRQRHSDKQKQYANESGDKPFGTRLNPSCCEVMQVTAQRDKDIKDQQNAKAPNKTKLRQSFV